MTQAVKKSTCNAQDAGKESLSNEGDQVQSLNCEGPLEKEMATHSSILA